MAETQPPTRAAGSSGAGPADPHGDALDLEPLWQLVEGSGVDQAIDPLVGLTVGGVTLERLIAEGGMGRVYEGRQESPCRAVAVKILRPGLLARNSIRRFLRETEILAQLRHPWITQVFSAGTFDIAGTQLPYFVMELIPGAQPITDHVRGRRLAARERLALFCQVCDAVAHAHENGVIHRDLKPSNVLVDVAGRPKVIDFGIARDGSEATDPITMTCTGQMLGTLQYMSPEQVDGTTTVDARSDVYSLGVILHELVADTLPYDVSREPLVEAARIIRDERAPTVRLVDRETPPGVALVIDTSLQKDPRHRYRDAAAMADAVRGLLDGRRPFGDRVARAQLTLRRLRGSKWKALAAAAAVMLALAGFMVMTRHPLLRGARAAAAAAIIPPAPEAATAAFRHAFTSVVEPNADRYLVEASGMSKWDDPRENPRVTYWGPAEDGVEGRLVYRVRFPGPTAAIRLTANCQCWDFLKHPGGFGRGVSAIEASRDGATWVTLRDNIQHRDWGASWEIDGPLPTSLLGTDEFWLRLRFLTEHAELDRGYTVAQFARSVTGRNETVFAIEADCVPPDDPP
jgi:hypothetical protein